MRRLLLSPEAWESLFIAVVWMIPAFVLGVDGLVIVGVWAVFVLVNAAAAAFGTTCSEIARHFIEGES